MRPQRWEDRDLMLGSGRRRDRQDLLRLLSWALVESRQAAFTGDAERARRLADVFHNVPAALAARIRPADILDDVRRRCVRHDLGDWLDQATTSGGGPAWTRLSAKGRREALILSARGLLHPDPIVRQVAREWSQRPARRWPVFVVVVIAALVVAVAVAGWGIWSLLAALPGGLLFVQGRIAMRRLRRVNTDPGAPIATSEDWRRYEATAGFHPGWFLESAAMIVGFLVGLPFAVVGILVVIGGAGSRITAAVLGLVGAAMLTFAVRVARRRIQARSNRRPDDESPRVADPTGLFRGSDGPRTSTRHRSQRRRGEGGAGVREPRRPLPSNPPATQSREMG